MTNDQRRRSVISHRLAQGAKSLRLMYPSWIIGGLFVFET